MVGRRRGRWGPWAALSATLVLGFGTGSCGRAEIHWHYEQCPTVADGGEGALAPGMMVRADRVLWSKALKAYGLERLPERLPRGALRLRIWHSTAFDRIESGLELRREAGAWTASSYVPPAGTDCAAGTASTRGLEAALCARPLALPDHWGRTWDALRWVGLLDFRGDARLDGQRAREPQGGWWFVEFVDGERTGAYAFTDPEGEACRQSEAFVRSLRLLGRELGWGLVAG